MVIMVIGQTGVQFSCNDASNLTKSGNSKFNLFNHKYDYSPNWSAQSRVST